MSFRGRYPTRFRRSGSKRPFFSERGRSFRRHYSEDKASSFRNIRNLPNDHFYKRYSHEGYHHSEQGRGRRAAGGKYFNLQRSDFPKGRYTHHERHRRDRSPSYFQQRSNVRRSIERSRTPYEWSGEEEFLVLSETAGSHHSGSLIEGIGSHDEEIFDTEEYFERRSISPFIIHKNFERHVSQNSGENSFHERSLSPIVIRTSFEKDILSDTRRSYEKRRSPIRRSRIFKERCQSSLRRSRSFEENDYFSELERPYDRSRLPVRRSRSRERRNSILDDCGSYSMRSLSPIKRQSRDRRETRIHRKNHEIPPDKYSLSSIEREIKYEKRRQLQMLEHQKKCHEKRSESSIERFLDDCKRSIENKSQSSSHSKRRNSLEKRLHRSVTPEKTRKFKGLDKITIERGRSFEKSPQPSNVTENMTELFVDKSPSYTDTRQLPDRHDRPSEKTIPLSPVSKAGSFEQGLSPEDNRKKPCSDIQLELSPISQPGSFERREFSKANNTLLENTSQLSPISQPGSFEKREFSQTNNTLLENTSQLSPISQPGSFEKREFSQTNNKLDLSPISHTGSLGLVQSCEKDNNSENRMELSPISQPGSFERREFSGNHERSFKELSNLSDISQAGSFEKQKEDFKTDRPDSADSMQKFLAELERSCERSRSSTERSRSSSPDKNNIVPRNAYEKRDSHQDINEGVDLEYHKYSGKRKRNNEDHRATSTFQTSQRNRPFPNDQYYKHCDNQNKCSTSEFENKTYGRVQEPQMKTSVLGNELFNKYRNRFSDHSRFDNDGKHIHDHYDTNKFRKPNEISEVHSNSTFKSSQHLQMEESIFSNRNTSLDSNNWENSFKPTLDSSNVDKSSYKSPRKFLEGKFEKPAVDLPFQQTFETQKDAWQRSEGVHTRPSISKPPNNNTTNTLLYHSAENQYFTSNSHSQGYQTSSARQETIAFDGANNLIQTLLTNKSEITSLLNQYPQILKGPGQNVVSPDRNGKSNQGSQFSDRINMQGNLSHTTTGLNQNSWSPPIVGGQLQNERASYRSNDRNNQLNWQFSPVNHGNTHLSTFERQSQNNQSQVCQQNINKPNFQSQNNQSQVFQQNINKPSNFQGFETLKQFESQNQLYSGPNNHDLNPEFYQGPVQNVQFHQGLDSRITTTLPFERYNTQQISLSNKGKTESSLQNHNPYRPTLETQKQNESLHSSIERSNQLQPYNLFSGGQSETFLDCRTRQTKNSQYQPFINRPTNFPSNHKDTEKLNDRSMSNQMEDQSALHQTSEQLTSNTFQFHQGSTYHHNDRLVQSTPYKQGIDGSQFIPGSERANQNTLFQRRFQTQPTQLPAQGVQFKQTTHNYVISASDELVDIKNYLSTTFSSRVPTLLPKPKYYVKEVVMANQPDSNKQNAVLPDPVMLEKYKHSSPSPEELGKMLEGFVIYFGVRSNSDLEKDPFVVIQESFSKSDRFGNLQVEEMEYQTFQPEPIQVCILRWHNVMLVRAEGPTREEARQNAGISLINALAHSCYTVQAKYSYYCGGKLPLFMLREKEKPGIFKVISREELTKAVTDQLKLLREQGMHTPIKGVDATNIQVVLNFVEEFFSKNESTHCELLFGTKDSMQYTISELKTIVKFAESLSGLQARTIKGFGRGLYSAVSRSYTPQLLCSYLLAYGQDHMRYRLIPPQGPRIQLLLSDAQYSPDIIKSVFQNTELAPGGSPFTSQSTKPQQQNQFTGSRPFRGGRGGRGGRSGRGGRGGAKRGRWN